MQWAEDVIDNESMNKKKSKSKINLSMPFEGRLGAQMPLELAMQSLLLYSITTPRAPSYLQSAAYFTNSGRLGIGVTTRTAMQSAKHAIKKKKRRHRPLRPSLF